jgi:hypothetical protein
MRLLLLAVLVLLPAGCQPRRPGPRALQVTVMATGRVGEPTPTPLAPPTRE